MPNPLHAWLWKDPARRARTLLRFAEVEADGGRDLVRAAELTADPVLRRLFLVHARDERRHADLFRERGTSLLRSLPAQDRPVIEAAWMAPGERGLDDLRVDAQDDAALLAFLHLSEKSAARDFAAYRRVLDHDLETRSVFDQVLHDEVFHMNYTAAQLGRVDPATSRRRLWFARGERLWKTVVRLMTGIAGLMGTVMLTLQYFLLLPLFAWLARRAQVREQDGWQAVKPERNGPLDRQY